MSGSSQVVRMINGVDRGSEENVVEKFKWFSSFCHSSDRLVRLTRKLYEVTLVQIFLLFESHVSGRSISDGKMIFSIVGDLGFEHSLFHRCLRFLLVGLNLLLLRRLQRLKW